MIRGVKNIIIGIAILQFVKNYYILNRMKQEAAKKFSGGASSSRRG
jgi:hypothetical protein